MLKYRAASFWVSEYAPELAMGMRTEDEQQDIGPEDIDHEVLSTTVGQSVNKTVDNIANKKDFNFDDAKIVDGSKPAQSDPKKVEDPEKTDDTITKAGQDLAKKEELEAQKVNSADAGIQPAFGFPKPTN
nr:hypothetical protein [Tanacetum cinerariifolium]